jgi:hypothetical protein
MGDLRIGDFIVTMSPDYKPGDPAPSGYLDWHAWAEVQHKAGLRLVQCPGCSRWQYPQELSTRVRIAEFMCLECADKVPLRCEASDG